MNVKMMCVPNHALTTFPVTDHFPFGPVHLITAADPDLPAPLKPVYVADHLHLRCHDIDEPIPGFRHPNTEHAAAVRDFHQKHRGEENFLFSCTAGAGRSQAVMAALCVLSGSNPTNVFQNASYNRLLYRLVVEAGGGVVPPEPLVSMVVRLKYPVDRAAAFLLSMERQRYKNWQVVFVSDGPMTEQYKHPIARQLLDHRCSVIETTEKAGRWGHPYRQFGIDRALLNGSDFIGLSNDDNYYAPGYLDQMIYALETEHADLVLCDYLAHYHGYQVVKSSPQPFGCDLGSWLARADLVKSTPWEGVEFTSDGLYVERLAAKAKGIAYVRRPLFVHN